MEKSDGLERTNSEVAWLPAVSGIVCALLIACNLALMSRYRSERELRIREGQLRAAMEEESRQRQSQMLEMALQEKSDWEAENRILLHRLEKSLDFLAKEDYSGLARELSQEEYPTLPLAYYLKGVAYAELGDDDRALTEFSTYLDSFYFSDYARLRRARIYAKRGQHGEAKEEVLRILDHRADFEEARRLLEGLENTGAPADKNGADERED